MNAIKNMNDHMSFLGQPSGTSVKRYSGKACMMATSNPAKKIGRAADAARCFEEKPDKVWIFQASGSDPY
jgi:hypothetical protein